MIDLVCSYRFVHISGNSGHLSRRNSEILLAVNFWSICQKFVCYSSSWKKVPEPLRWLSTIKILSYNVCCKGTFWCYSGLVISLMRDVSSQLLHSMRKLICDQLRRHSLSYYLKCFVSDLLLLFIKVYEITGRVSELYFKGYNKLSKSQKIEWKNRYDLFSCLLVSFLLQSFSRWVWKKILVQGVFYVPCNCCCCSFFLLARSIWYFQRGQLWWFISE